MTHLSLMTAATAETSELYRHFGEDDSLLYVGISLSTLQRLGQHKDNSIWFKKIKRVEIQHFDSREAALAAEREAIINEKPFYNKHHKFSPKPATITKYFTRPRFGRINVAATYSGLSRTRIYEIAPRVPGLLRKLQGQTLVDFDVLDGLLDALPPAKIKPPAA